MTGPTAGDAEAYIRTHLPLAASIDVRVSALDASPGTPGPILTAPLAPNANHLGTAFGGSLATLAILAGWAAVHFRLDAAGHRARTVVQRTSMEYLEPARDDLEATAGQIAEDGWARLLRGLRRHGRGRVDVAVEIRSGGAPVARFEGRYAALRE